MNDDTLKKLLRLAGEVPPPDAEMPFAFDTRVLAHVAAARNVPDFIAVIARRTAMIAAAVILVAGFGWYQTSSDDDDTAAYAMADTVIDQNMLQ